MSDDESDVDLTDDEITRGHVDLQDVDVDFPGDSVAAAVAGAALTGAGVGIADHVSPPKALSSTGATEAASNYNSKTSGVSSQPTTQPDHHPSKSKPSGSAPGVAPPNRFNENDDDDLEFYAACTADMAFRSGIKFKIATR